MIPIKKTPYPHRENFSSTSCLKENTAELEQNFSASSASSASSALVIPSSPFPKKQLSQDLSTNIQLSNDEVHNAGKHIKKYKKRINQTIDSMEDILEKETSKERDDIEKAIKKLQKKVEEVKETRTYKTFEKELSTLENKLNITMEKVFEQYSKCIRKIYESYSDQKIRALKLNEFHEVLGDAFLTKDERKIISLIKMKISEMPSAQKVIEL